MLNPKTFPLSYETDIELNQLKAKVVALEHEKKTAKKTSSTTTVTSATIVEKDDEIKELNAKVKSIQYNMDQVMKDCKDDMHNLEIVNERAVDAETHLENENVRLNENDLYLRKQYMGL